MPRRPPQQETLFGDPEPVEAARPTVRIRPTTPRARLGKRQKTFNNLVDRITRQTRKLQRWQDYLPQLAQRVEREMQPQLDAQLALERRLALELAALLDQHQKPRLVANIYRQRVRAWMLDLADSVLTNGGPDPELIALRDQHGSGQDEVTRQEQALALLLAIEDLFGEEFAAGMDADSGDAVLDELERRLAGDAEGAAESAAQRGAEAGPNAGPKADREHHAGRAGRAGGPDPVDPEAEPEAEPTARSAARRADAQRAGKDPLRSLFRRLASSLHPDRETDPETRTEKTALMQRANDAHERRDLLELLRLQMELEQIDAQQLAALPEETLEHYISELREQARTLDEQLEDLIGHLRVHVPRSRSFTPEEIDRSLDGDIARTKHDILELERALTALEQPKTRRQLFAAVPKPDPRAEGEATFARLVQRLAMLAEEYEMPMQR